MNSSLRVLIVDRSAESREVLCAMVERLGARAVPAATPQQGIEQVTINVGLSSLDLVVLDTDSDLSTGHQDSHQLQAAAGRSGAPIVVLGTFSRKNPRPKSADCVAKPYHYAPLVRKIEALLASRPAA